MEDLIAYKRSVAVSIKTFKKAKKDNFRNFAETINSGTDIKYVWNKCKIFKNRWVKATPFYTSENLQLTERVSDMLSKICPPWVNTDPTKIPICQENPFFDYYFDFVEYNVALDSKHVGSSPGLDGIDYEILKKTTN